MKNLDWSAINFFFGYHALILFLFPIYLFFGSPKGSMFIAMFILITLTGISITAGYHRFYSHKSYKVNSIIELILLFFGTMALQGSVFRWASNHRLHHRFVDREGDPYNVRKGFWHAHLLWLMYKQPPLNREVISDLTKKRILELQHKYLWLFSVGTNGIAFLVIGFLLQDFFGAFVIATLLRLFIVHHGTAFINSAAHYWGEKTYSKELSAVDNFFLALLTFGEGYHNYHHVFSSDYRNGVKWYHYDPTKWLVWLLNKVGWAKDLVRVDPYITKKRLIVEDKKLLFTTITQKFSSKKGVLEKHINQLSAKMNSTMEDVGLLMKEYKSLKKRKAEKALLKPIKITIKDLKKSFRKDWAQWCWVSKTITSSKKKKDKLFKELFAPTV